MQMTLPKSISSIYCTSTLESIYMWINNHINVWINEETTSMDYICTSKKVDNVHVVVCNVGNKDSFIISVWSIGISSRKFIYDYVKSLQMRGIEGRKRKARKQQEEKINNHKQGSIERWCYLNSN